jgi:hypothetical protein
MTLRIPFRFGVTTLTSAPQAFVRVRIGLPGGGEAEGTAAELMVPKWFDKNPDLTNEDNFGQLRTALRLTAQAYRAHGADTAFGMAARNASSLAEAGGAEGLDGLVTGFGPALVDRAIMAALCNYSRLPFASAMRANLAGMRSDLLPADLDDFAIDPFLASLKPRSAIAARHTVGMVDPLTSAEADEYGLPQDGLPRSLDEVIAAYGPRYYKIKLSGDVGADIDRLSAIAALLDEALGSYRATLDGNEQYGSADSFGVAMAAFRAEPRLSRLLRSTLFVEQPLKRGAALSADVAELSNDTPLLIDESDGDMDAFVRARKAGYRGVSSKDCKGFYRAIVNAARCRAWNAEAGEERYFLSGEDLTCPSGLAVQQDLALVALLGITHVERNGHHYFAGMEGAPSGEASAFLAAHGDLYERFRDGARLKLKSGRIDMGSLQDAGFGSSLVPDLTRLEASDLAASQ